MTNKQKMLESVKKHLDINYKYLTPIGFEVELEKIVKKIDDLSYEVNVLKDQVNMLEDEASDLENHVSDLKNEIKDLKEKLKNNES